MEAVVGISAMSIAGVATRISLLNASVDARFFTNSSQISVNLFGSFLIGFFWGYPTLEAALPHTYTSLAVGFCGSLTTFSSWIYAIMKPQSDWSAELLTGLSIPFIGFLLGRDLAALCGSVCGSKESLKWVDRGIVSSFAVAVLCAMVTVSITAPPNISGEELASCAVGPLGALTRWILSKLLNGRLLQHFMLGTLLSNLIAVILVGSLTSCRDTHDWCEYGVIGIAGSLSTVSSWVLDTFKIYPKSPWWAYLYCLSTVGLGLAIMAPFVR